MSTQAHDSLYQSTLPVKIRRKRVDIDAFNSAIRACPRYVALDGQARTCAQKLSSVRAARRTLGCGKYDRSLKRGIQAELDLLERELAAIRREMAMLRGEIPPDTLEDWSDVPF